ncbi:uncharacterized protein LOC143266086 [Megachile rotundata]|uniref:uncharacterized protein LOC143266086 n=1 Tax=Megachile rotundata TaxID=143995 RepID=UPI003FD2E363
MEQVDEDAASDAEHPGPGCSVTDLSVYQGTIDDDTACNMDNGIMNFYLPLEDASTKCPAYFKIGRLIQIMCIKDLAKHIREYHITDDIIYTCSSCKRTFDKLHGWRCHYSKCKGPMAPDSDTQEQNQFICQACSRSFETKIGLSMHERHAHPDVRNDKRAAQFYNEGRKGARRKVWSIEEEEGLKVLNERFKDNRFPNVEIRKFFPDKTLKQISDKRIEIMKKEATARLNEEAEDENVNIENVLLVDNRDVNSTEINYIDDNLNNLDLNLDHNNEVDLGLINLTNSINERAEVPPGAVEVLNNLELYWKQYCSDKDVEQLKNGINEFLANKLIPYMLANENNEEIQEEHINTNERKRYNKTFNNTSNRKRNKNNKKRRNVCRNINNNENKNNNNNNYKYKNTSNKRKTLNYARCQDLYKNCPTKLADIVVNDQLSNLIENQPLPETKEISDLYNKLWGVKGPLDNNNKQFIRCDDEIPIERILIPITSTEITNKINKLKNKTAAGPDGILKRHLLVPGMPNILSKLFNILLTINYILEKWKINRTTLIPKMGKNLKDIKNWRPITIGSILNRIFSSLLDYRLRLNIKQFQRQKGFSEESGCRFNILLLNELITKAKMLNGGVFQILDISKAFDTVPHAIIISGLKRRGVSEKICELVKDMYTNCTTEIKTNDKNNKILIKLERGVKQGDPLSPLLFNLSIEALLEYIENSSQGISVSENEKVATLAFVDDIGIISQDRKEAQTQINKVVE